MGAVRQSSFNWGAHKEQALQKAQHVGAETHLKKLKEEKRDNNKPISAYYSELWSDLL